MFCYCIKANTASIYDLSPSNSVREYDRELDNIVSLLLDVCDALDETKSITFCVAGFGQSPWPVDVGTDLLVLLEQLPEFVDWMVRAGDDSYKLDFYEQGIERSLTFERVGDMVRIVCLSRTDWRPDPPIEFVTLEDLRSMQTNFLAIFFRLADVIAPSVVSHEWFRSWRTAVGEPVTFTLPKLRSADVHP